MGIIQSTEKTQTILSRGTVKYTENTEKWTGKVVQISFTFQSFSDGKATSRSLAKES